LPFRRLHFDVMQTLQCGRFRLDLSRPRIMAIVNVTPDSFSGDGVAGDVPRAVERARRLVDEGADIVDIGGESTRPGAQPVLVAEELRRILPVVEVLADLGVPISVDTRRSEVMRAALAAGADMINDVCALGAEAAAETIAGTSAAVCLMHMRGIPESMQADPRYEDVLGEVCAFLSERANLAQRAGIEAGRIVVDPGFGFGKRFEHNLALLKRLDRIADIGFPVLVGLSRKSFLGSIADRPVQERAAASVAAALMAVDRGARIVRVHDVAATRDALKIWTAIAPR